MEIKVYTRKELCKELGITKYQWDRRNEDLLAWLDDFFIYEIVQQKGHDTLISIKQIIKEYKPMPMKATVRASLIENYTKKVDEIVQQNNRTNGSILGRKLVNEHKQERNHKVETCQKWCRQVLNANYEPNDKVWCTYLDAEKINYRLLTQEELDQWKGIRKNYLDDEACVELLSDYSEGEISQTEYEKQIAGIKANQYKSALQEFRSKTGAWPVLIPKWDKNGFDKAVS